MCLLILIKTNIVVLSYPPAACSCFQRAFNAGCCRIKDESKTRNENVRLLQLQSDKSRGEVDRLLGKLEDWKKQMKLLKQRPDHQAALLTTTAKVAALQRQLTNEKEKLVKLQMRYETQIQTLVSRFSECQKQLEAKERECKNVQGYFNIKVNNSVKCVCMCV